MHERFWKIPAADTGLVGDATTDEARRTSMRFIIVLTVPPKTVAAGKPKTGMLERAAREHGLDVQRSFVVGDRYGDVELARNARARSILVRSGYGEGELAWHAEKWPVQPDFVAEDLAQAADWILRQQK